MDEAKRILLRTATPDSIARLAETTLDRNEQERLCEVYFDNLVTSLGQCIKSAMASMPMSLIFITTHSRLLTKVGRDDLERYLDTHVMILPLQQINTELQFAEKISTFLKIKGPKVLLVQIQVHQIDQGHLIECKQNISKLDF